ncbi:MAG: exosortase family protein XrtF [Bacteroidetes bacterium]|nr:exosortase family protein XrtF [Bacteroidota bacterium]
MNFDFIKQNKKAITFLLVFVALYIGLNTIYGFYTQTFLPTSDPITRSVSSQVVWFLSFFDSSIASFPSGFSEYVAVGNDRETLIYVFEGCNGVNVVIVYFSFIVAFSGPVKLFAKYAGIGLISIHVLNIARIGLLYGVAFYFPEQLYFFHKYLFTGIIYVVVFVLWYFWVRSVKT